MKNNLTSKKDYSILYTSFLVTIIVSAVVFMGILFGDGVGNIVEPLLGASAKEIKDTSNMTLLQNMGWFVYILPVLIFICAFMLIKYLNYGFEGGIFTIPYKEDF